MTPPPSRAPECPRLRTGAPRDSNALVTIFLLLFSLPFLGGATGSLVFASEAIGPLVTLVVWIAIIVVTMIRTGRVSIEILPVIGILVVLQLLLDLHTPHLGDVVIAALHAIVILIGLVSQLRGRRAR